MTTVKYSLGFCFNSDKTKVKLIRKNHPSFQAGKLNGIGGQANINEFAISCMIREFLEETGVNTEKLEWNNFGYFLGEDYCCCCYVMFNDLVFNKVESKTSELIETIDVKDFNMSEMVDKVPWLLYMCLDKDIPTICYSVYQND